MRLGLEDERVHQLAERLRYWQWPDGGWNCDKEPSAHTSTFIHTLYSMRGLALYAQHTGDAESMASAQRAAEFFLKRRLYKRVSTGAVIAREFVKLCQQIEGMGYVCYMGSHRQQLRQKDRSRMIFTVGLMTVLPKEAEGTRYAMVQLEGAWESMEEDRVPLS